jgi:hypothetical protein
MVKKKFTLFMFYLDVYLIGDKSLKYAIVELLLNIFILPL